MRYFDNGCFFSVTCNESDVYAFARRWPCFGSTAAITFQFDKATGDLVDVSRSTDDNDGTGICALADDAKAYGIRRMREIAERDLRKSLSVTLHHSCVEVAAILGDHRKRMSYHGYTKAQAIREYVSTFVDATLPAVARQ